MERDRRAVTSTFFVEETLNAGTTLSLSDAAAHHARVKRLEIGDSVRLTDGAGRVAFGALAALSKKVVQVRVSEVERVPPQAAVHIRVPIGDRDRMLWLAEKATELGVATWQAVRFRRSASVSPRGEGDAFAAKVRARMVSALEQSGGAWLPRMLPDVGSDAVDLSDGHPILLDPTGPALPRVLQPNRSPVLMFGPEGGFEADERAQLVASGWRTASLAATVLRFETAGVAAVAVCRAHYLGETDHG